MKLFKRFFLLKKGIGAAAAAALLAFSSCENMTTSLSTPTLTIVGSKTLTTPTNFKVTHGGKRKISLSWDTVGIAKSYRIFSATSPNDTFIQVGESQKNIYDDTVGAGRTYYYKVCAVNYKGETSEFTVITEGTSLATPVISSIDTQDNSATISWYMENSKSYENELRFDVYCQKGSEVHQATVNGDIGFYTFEGLNSNTDYTYYVEAYLTNDQSAVETSPKVTKDTVAQYSPVSPEFTVSQGESIDSINLFITLPSMVQVSTTKGNETVESIVDYPLCFEIQRKKTDEADSAYKTITNPLYYNGDLKAPASYSYKAGELIEYKDVITSSQNSAERGIKYDYRIFSYIDTNFSKTSNPKYNYDSKVKSRIANKGTGWAVYKPVFEIKSINNEYTDNKKKITSTTINFKASWDALGKESIYRFAVLEGFTTPSGYSTSWLEYEGSKLLANISDVNKLTAFYNLAADGAAITGNYQYTLYVIPETYTDPSKAVDDKAYLTYVLDKNSIAITDDAETPTANFASIEDGWTDHVTLSWQAQEDVSYGIERAESNDPSAARTTVCQGKTAAPGTLLQFDDNTVAQGCAYEYWLVATKGTTVVKTPIAAKAKTLGTAAPQIDDYSYDDIKVSWPIVVGAEKYKVTLGGNGSLGGGKYFTVNVDRSDDSDKYKLVAASDSTFDNSDYDIQPNADPTLVDSGNITLTIKKPAGYDSAAISGKPSILHVEAFSEKTSTAKSKDVWTIGPASNGIQGTDSTSISGNSIVITWKGLTGAAGYAIYRKRPAFGGSTTVDASGTATEGNYADENTCVYYISKDKETITADGANVKSTYSDANSTITTVSVVASNNAYDSTTTYTLTDNFKKKSAETAWDKDQSYIGFGVDYVYTVVPVLDASHADARQTAYSDLATVANIRADGYTSGYGLNLEASKAEFTDGVVLTWTKPARLDKRIRTPSIYYRKIVKAGETKPDWTKAVSLPASYDKDYFELKYNLEVTKDSAGAITGYLMDYLEPMEFAVTYNSTFDSADDATYITYLGNVWNEKITGAGSSKVAGTETNNVGYMFTLPQIACSKTENDNYSEDATWYFYNELNHIHRAIVADGPYELSFTNYNNAAPTKTLVKYLNNGNISYTDSLTGSNATMTTSGKNVTLTPIKSEDNSYLGLMRVLRDTKHYYTISTTRASMADKYKFKEISAITQPSSEIKAQSTGYAFRKITPTEFTKCVTLIMADSLNQAGSREGNLIGQEGNLSIILGPGPGKTLGIGNRFYYQYVGYKANFAKAPGLKTSRLASAFILNSNKSAEGYCIDNITKELGTITINVTHESGLPSYTGTLTLSAGNYFSAHYDLSLSATSGAGSLSPNVSISNNDKDFQKWFPFTVSQALPTDQTDGTKLANGNTCWTYQSPWWE